MNLTGKVALITGAAVGIGRACAIRMAQSGAKLALIDIDIQKLQAVRQELGEYTNNILVAQCDVSDETAVNQVVQDALARFGQIDILVNNAALWRSKKPFTELDTADWQKFLAINVMGVVYCTKAVLSGMQAQGYGRIINVASVAGVYGNANMVHYSATKGAVIAMTRALAKEVTGLGITVNAVSPGSVSPADNPDITHTQESTLSFAGRTGSALENADLICFLASNEAGYISGQNIQIDGCRKKQ